MYLKFAKTPSYKEWKVYIKYDFMETINTIDKLEMLEKAESHIYSTGPNDAATKLCYENMKFGLAKIRYIRKQLGMTERGDFIATPDMTITRNKTRWENGFGYGGLVTWGDEGDEFIVLDSKPNACGMLVGSFDKLPSKESL